MTAFHFTALFASALLLTTLTKLWLARRHLNHIQSHRSFVPPDFIAQIDLTAHQKAADNTSTKTRLGILNIVFDATLLMLFTLGGGIQYLAERSLHAFNEPLLQGTAVILAVLLISAVLESPFGLYRTFVIEARFGFNKTTPMLYLIDTIKGLILGAILGLPLLFGVLWIMGMM